MGAPFLNFLKDPRQTAGDFLDEVSAKFGKAGLDGLALRRLLTGSLPNTRVRMTHAYTLRTANGQIIGAVQSVDERQRREVDDHYEVDPNAHGEVADMSPGVLSGRTLSIERFDLYASIMEEALGTSELVMLTDQSVGLKLRDHWSSPSGVLFGGQKQYEYLPCWFTDLGRSKKVDGDRLVRVSAELVWGRKRRVA